VTIAASKTEFVAVYRWFSWLHLLLALGGLLLAVVAFSFLRGGTILAVVIGPAAAYVALVTVANRTTIRATREVLQARHGPIKIIAADAMDAFGFWPDVRDSWVPTASLLAIATGRREVMDLSPDRDASPMKVYLRAVFHDGVDQAEIQLLPSTAPLAVETCIGWHLGRWLQDADLPHYRGVDLTP
jgi:hypothetical protein